MECGSGQWDVGVAVGCGSGHRDVGVVIGWVSYGCVVLSYTEYFHN